MKKQHRRRVTKTPCRSAPTRSASSLVTYQAVCTCSARRSAVVLRYMYALLRNTVFFNLPPFVKKIATSVLKLNVVESKHCPRRLQYLRLDLRLQTPRGLRPGFIFSAKSHPPDPPPAKTELCIIMYTSHDSCNNHLE